ncbi:MAG: hypothetical protein H7A43_04470 [Verrucomicrobia bacterium]|nr:hypothetical protein [Verrucomicrobiota bacterium]
MVRRVADYRFCSHGMWCQSGRHPFADSVTQHALPMLAHLFSFKNLAELKAQMDMVLLEKSAPERSPPATWTLAAGSPPPTASPSSVPPIP